MMARTRNPRRRISPATTFLIRAFAPGCPTMLRHWTSQKVSDGELVTIFFDLPDQRAVDRALELQPGARSLRLVRVGRTIIHDMTADVSGEHRTLKVEALLASDNWGKA